MKIILIANSSFYLYNFRQSLITAFSNAGHEVVLLAPVDEYSDRIKNARFIPLKNLDRKSMNPIKELFLLKELFSILRKEKPLTILAFTIKPNIYGSIAAGILRMPIITNITGLGYLFIKKKHMFVSFVVKTLYNLAFRFPVYYVFQNDDDVKLFIDNFGVDKSKCITTPGSGVNLNEFEFTIMPTVADDKFLMVARVLVDKGIKEYIAAARSVKAVHPNVSLCLIGPIDDNNPAGLSLNELQELNGDRVVDYLGEKSNVGDYLKECTCFVLPSYREGTPRTNLEALSVGRPIITTDVPGCRNTVIDGDNGFLVADKDSKSLADAIMRFINLSKQSKQAMSKSSRKKAEQEFDEKIVIDKYLEIIKSI